jgi:DNA-binding transcriptional LysR family regulator
MQFTLRQIELFAAVCECGSISLAAERNHTAQSAVSTAIRNLEAALGVTLLVRNHAVGVEPTQEGRVLLDEAGRLLAAAHDLESHASTLTERVVGTVHVGFLVTFAPLLMPGAIRSFADQYPGARIEALEGDHDELLTWLRDGTISIAVSYDLGVSPGISFQSIRPAPPGVLISAEDRLAAANSLTPADLADEPLVLIDLPWSADYFLGIFARAGVEPRIAFRSRSMEVVRSLVGQGLGYTIINVRPKSTETLDGRELVCLPLVSDTPDLHLGLATHAAKRRSAAVRAAIQHLAGL